MTQHSKGLSGYRES